MSSTRGRRGKNISVSLPPVRPKRKWRASDLPIPEYLQKLILLIPVITSLIFVYSFSVDMPMADQWGLVPALQHMHSGHLHWEDIYRQHNEARIPVVEATWLLLAKLTKFSATAQAYLCYASLVASVGILYAFFRRMQPSIALPTIAFLPVPALLLGWRGYDAMLWGSCLVNDFGLMFGLASIWCCLRAPRSLAYLLASIAAAQFSVFSTGTGLMMWLVGLYLLYYLKARPVYVTLWLVSAIGSWILYFTGYEVKILPWPSGLGYVLAHPLDSLQYSLTFAGAAMGGSAPRAMEIGIGIVAVLIAAVGTLWRDRESRDVLLPFSAALLFMVLSLLPLLQYRLGLGWDQSYTASRYAPLAAIWPVCAYMASLVLSRKYELWRGILAVLVIVIVLGLVGGYRQGFQQAAERAQTVTACQDVLRNYRSKTDFDITCYFPEPLQARRWAFWLDQWRWSVFNHQR